MDRSRRRALQILGGAVPAILGRQALAQAGITPAAQMQDKDRFFRPLRHLDADEAVFFNADHSPVGAHASLVYGLEASTGWGPWAASGALLLGTAGTGSMLVPFESGCQLRLFRLRDSTYDFSGWPARLTVSLTAARQPVLAGTGTVGATYELLASENLLNWTAVTSVPLPASGSFQFIDLDSATNSMRVYRLRQADP